MSTHVHRMDSDQDQDTLFHSYPCAYYVQSPSTISHANSADIKTNNFESSTIFHSPIKTDSILLNKNPDDHDHEVSRLITLSRYSSSRGSNNSFVNEKKIGGENEKGASRLIIVDAHDHHGEEEEEDGDDSGDDDDDYEYYYGKRAGWWRRYCSFRRSSSCSWVSLQISWRLVVSLGVALLVFYIATKPPPPKISVKMAGIRQFGLGEGVDGSGVTTKILTCNSTMDLLIENKSKLFGLHIQPPTLEMFFGRLSFAVSRGSKLYAGSHGSTLFQLYVGTRNKPMYGAGRNMQDMLESGNGLPIKIRVSLSSNFRVVWSLIKPKFRHQAECLLVLDTAYDKKHQTQAYNSTCIIS